MRIKNLWAVAITVCTLLSCSDSDNSMNEPIVQGKKAAITVKIKGSTVTRAQTGEESTQEILLFSLRSIKIWANLLPRRLH